MEAFFPAHGPSGNWWFDLLALVFFCVFLDWRRPRSMRTLDLIVLCWWAVLGEYEEGPQPIVTALSYVPLLYLWVRLALALRRGEPRSALPVSLVPARVLSVLSVVFLAYCIGLTLAQPFPFGHVGDKSWSLSESSIVGSYGAEQVLEGRPPYGNIVPPRQRSAKIWATYGPAYYVWFVPWVAVLGVGNPFFDWAAPARLATIVLVILSFIVIRRLGRTVGGELGMAAFGFAWAGLPYLQHAAYWSWTGHLAPGFMSIAVLWMIARQDALGTGVAVGLAAATSYVPLAWVPLTFARLRTAIDRRRLAIGATSVIVLFFGLAICQPDGVMKFYRDAASYAIPGEMPAWRYKWSPFTYHAWARAIRLGATVTLVPMALAVWWAAWRGRLAGFTSIAAACGLLLVHAELIKGHAPGRMILWTLPFLLVVMLPGIRNPNTPRNQ